MEPCSTGGSNRSKLCHSNITYNYVDVLAVSTCFTWKTIVISYITKLS